MKLTKAEQKIYDVITEAKRLYPKVFLGYCEVNHGLLYLVKSIIDLCKYRFELAEGMYKELGELKSSKEAMENTKQELSTDRKNLTMRELNLNKKQEQLSALCFERFGITLTALKKISEEQFKQLEKKHATPLRFKFVERLRILFKGR